MRPLGSRREAAPFSFFEFHGHINTIVIFILFRKIQTEFFCTPKIVLHLDFFPFVWYNAYWLSRCSAAGSAPVSGLNHHARRRIFEKSRKPLKTLTFSALPNVEKSSISRSDHMFDHLPKNSIFLPFRGVAKVVSRIVREQITDFRSAIFQNAENP